ncbi:hypothetical protein [Rhodococcus tibetensis]|uniref:BioF2-like acetyltransferase domain-containing protein n=1 Tax=Rhodococcus tibetensis TaxID=2965064 RepID=A0ABT1QED2_9NOCA|nr:hypothetical protein [Rhodococcus sp. FXJ9.536]MCQ4120654.1 hypothetical protein [Rhodococcus sp. FXJ9.536]
MEWQPQRDAFCKSHDVSQPQLPLMDIAHWDAVLQRREVRNESLHRELAYVAPGYFYMPVSDEPDERRLAALLDLASTADWLLVPSLLRSQRDRGVHVIAVPFMQAAYFRSSGRVDFTLRATVGDRQYKAITKLTSKAEAACDTEIHRLSELADDHRALHDFAVLQALNVAKYGHSRNLYTHNILRSLARSPEGTKYYLKLDYEKSTNAPVNASLSYADDERGVFTMLVQGLDRDRIPRGLNLYITDYYQLYQFADRLGFEDICLGRGAIESKVRVGANHVVDLDNWLIPVNTRQRQAMHEYAGMG